MTENLTATELIELVQRVFAPGPEDRQLAIMIDLPDEKIPDTPAWKERRELAAGWHEMLAPHAAEAGLERVDLLLYRNPHANNADLPATVCRHVGGPLPADTASMTREELPFTRVFAEYRLLVAPTQFSATAPLKMAAAKYNFRAATMPGFARTMIPALRLDYTVIGARVDKMCDLLTRANGCRFNFKVGTASHDLFLDLRHRPGHASGGVFKVPGKAGNLPSGESYIVPYEGEIEGDETRTSGVIPVQFGDEVVLYRVERNRAVEVISTGPTAKAESQHLQEEPAYGNLSELGLGVLGDFGLKPTGEILLDEKLGLHIAFGRSEHFGGQVGPDAFSAPDKVIHIDRVYIPEIQDQIIVTRAILEMADGEEVLLMANGEYKVQL